VEQYVTKAKEHIPILKQINQVNDDGSYTFGYENGDGSFRVETKDIYGNVQGKYGFVDEFGVLQVVDYVSGSHLGFQPKGMAPPVKVSPSTPEQRALDYQYSSTDDDQDGIPDYRPAYKAAYAAPAYDAPAYGAPAYPKAAPVPVVHHVAPIVHHVAPVDVIVPVPFAEEVVKVPQQGLRFVDPFGQIGQPRQPVTILNPDARTLENLASKSLDANMDGIPDELVGGFGALPAQQRQPVGILNPTAQQLEDLANQSLDLNKDGIPDELVGEFGPAAVVPVAPVERVVVPVTRAEFATSFADPSVSDQEMFRQLVELRRMELEQQRKDMEAQRLFEDRLRVEAENRLHAQRPADVPRVAVAPVVVDPFVVQQQGTPAGTFRTF